MPGEARLLGAGGELQRDQARLDGGIGGCPNVGGICIGCTMPGFPDKFMPFMDAPPGSLALQHMSGIYGGWSRPCAASPAHFEQGTEVAAFARRADHRLQAQALRQTRRIKRTQKDGNYGNRNRTPRKTAETQTETRKTPNVKEMSWDPITRIVGSLGIYTKIDFANKKVVECHSTSSIFRGYSIFMKNKDPRDTHFITSRICGICGDNHATCSVYAQNMAYGVKPPALAEWIVNLGEAAEYMFDHNIFQDNLVGVDFCEMMVKETNPGVWEKAKKTPAPHAKARLQDHRRHHDLAQSVRGRVLPRDAAGEPLTREMFCLMEGRHVHPSTLYAGGVGTVPSIQLFTDYLVRLMKYVEFMKKVVPLHDDLFDFFYEALPGYEEVGRAASCSAAGARSRIPTSATTTTRRWNDWGKAMFVTPGVVVDGKLVTTNLVDINLGIRILLGSSYYEDWDNSETFVTHDPLGNPVDKKHPWNQTTIPKPQKRNFDGNYTWVMSPRWLDKRTGDHLALDTGGGPIARLWATALAGLVDIGYVKATGNSVKINLPKTALKPAVEFEWKIPKWSNAIERDRARTYFQAYAAGCALYFCRAGDEGIPRRQHKTFTPFKVPDEAIGCGFHEAVRGVLSHHMVIRGGKVANYHPYPPTPWNANPRDIYGTPGPYEDAVQNTPIFEENGPDKFKGIDIMRAVRSFDPCLPCGVHMYLGNDNRSKTRRPRGDRRHRGRRSGREPALAARSASGGRC
jgi:hydrogenase large subunit